MLTIRLQRIGKKHQPSYRLVVAERRSKMGAPPTEDLGAYDPFSKKATFKADRVQYWLGVGAQPTVTAHNLLVKNGVVDAPKREVYMKKAEPKAEEAVPAEATPAEDTPSENKPPEGEAPPAKEEAAPGAEAGAEVPPEEKTQTEPEPEPGPEEEKS